MSLTVPAQEAVRDGDRYALRYEVPLPVEDWNAQISLLAGICAARIMIDGGIGLFRTLDAARAARPGGPAPQRPGARRRAGRRAPPTREVVRGLDPARPGHAAFAVRASRAIGGAGYAAWRAGDGEPPAHAAIAAPYAHVTAPLRRLADRVANDVVLALAAGAPVPAWALEALPGDARRHARHDRPRPRRRARGGGLRGGRRPRRARRRGLRRRGRRRPRRPAPWCSSPTPAVLAALDREGPRPGDALRVRLVRADPGARAVVLTPATR